VGQFSVAVDRAGQEWLPAQLHPGEAGRHVQCLDQQHLPGDELIILLKIFFVPWIKEAYQALARCRYRLGIAQVSISRLLLQNAWSGSR
jgi:hypothetical protein